MKVRDATSYDSEIYLVSQGSCILWKGIYWLVTDMKREYNNSILISRFENGETRWLEPHTKVTVCDEAEIVLNEEKIQG